MADTSSQTVSTVAPSDSASVTPGKKSKPGKAERAQRRSAVGSSPGNQASAQKAAMFASSVSGPKPQPGKFPVVFATGAGEPARDQTFSIDDRVLSKTLSEYPARFTMNAKYAEFKANAEIDDREFVKDLIVATLLRLSQQVVHSHVNMGLPQGDFAPMASTDVRVPASIAAFVSQHGEFSVPALGTRFLYSDYESTVNSLVWCADRVHSNGTGGPPLKRTWLPMSPSDGRTKAIVADRLRVILNNAEISVSPNVLEAGVLSGDVPDAWESIKPVLGDTDERRDRFDFLFKSYSDVGQFTTAFTTAEASAVLSELDLTWTNPSAGHLQWNFNAKTTFTRLSDLWARKSATYAQFFELSSSQTNRMAATGSQSQMAKVSDTDSVTVVKTHLALSAPEFSLVACFPATSVFSGDLPRRVVVTTPLNVAQRATEFVQMDWR